MTWFLPKRVTEATPQQRQATGASGGGGRDQWDTHASDYGYRRVGTGGPREIPERTREQARTDSIAGYRANPMARAILDTYVAFVVGDSGLTLTCTNDDVRAIAESYWTDPKNLLVANRELACRSWLVAGEVLEEMMVGAITGICRRNPIDPSRVAEIELDRGNCLWPAFVHLRPHGGTEYEPLPIAQLSDFTSLREGKAFWWPSFRTLETDTRGTPFLMPVLDWCDSYDAVLSNLIDRTALARYLAYQVVVDGEEGDVKKFIADRGSEDMPRSGTIEVTNKSVDWKPISAQSGSYEDSNTNKAILTSMAAGAGLSKTWLAEPEDANRATSLTMAEPVRRRVGSVQNEYMALRTEQVRYAVDQAIAAGRIPYLVPNGAGQLVPAADTVSVVGPQIAAADAKVTAEVLHKLSLTVKELAAVKDPNGQPILSADAGRILVQRGWESFMGVPYDASLDGPEMDTDKVAEHVDTHGGGIPDLTAA